MWCVYVWDCARACMCLLSRSCLCMCVWHVNNELASIVWTSLIHITAAGSTHSSPPRLHERSASKHALVFDTLAPKACTMYRMWWYESALIPPPSAVSQHLSRCSWSGRGLSTWICVFLEASVTLRSCHVGKGGKNRMTDWCNLGTPGALLPMDFRTLEGRY